MHHAVKGSELPPLLLPHVASGGIGRHTAAHLVAQVETGPPMAPGDLLELFCGNRFVVARSLTAQALGQPLELAIPAHLLHNGVQRFHYRLLKPGCCPRRSAPVEVAVKLNGPAALLPIRVAPHYLREGVFAERLGPGLDVRIEPYRNMAEGDAITLSWGDLRLDLAPLPAAELDQPVSARIPTELILEAGADPHLELSYCVLDRVGNASGWAPATCLRVHEGSA